MAIQVGNIVQWFRSPEEKEAMPALVHRVSNKGNLLDLQVMSWNSQVNQYRGGVPHITDPVCTQNPQRIRATGVWKGFAQEASQRK